MMMYGMKLCLSALVVSAYADSHSVNIIPINHSYEYIHDKDDDKIINECQLMNASIPPMTRIILHGSGPTDDGSRRSEAIA